MAPEGNLCTYKTNKIAVYFLTAVKEAAAWTVKSAFQSEFLILLLSLYYVALVELDCYS